MKRRLMISQPLEKIHWCRDKHVGPNRKKRWSGWFDDDSTLATERKNAAYRAVQQFQRRQKRAETYHDHRRV